MKAKCFLLSAFIMPMIVANTHAGDYRRVPVTDATDLAAMGFPADTENVFRIERESPEPPEAVRAGIGADPRAYGQDWSLLMGTEFIGTDDRFLRTPTGYPAELVCQTGATESRARARVSLRHDRQLWYLDVWAYDGSAATDLAVRLFENCSPMYAAGSPLVTEIASMSTTGNPGYTLLSTTLPGVYPDVQQCSYYLEANFGAGCPASGYDLRLSGARVVWRD